MNAFRIQALAASACLLLSVSSFATTPGFFGGNWHVVENLATQTCYRVTSFTPVPGWRDFGIFNSFRTAGRFVWSHRDVCKASPVFD